MIFTGCSNTLQDRLVDPPFALFRGGDSLKDWFPGILARDTSKVGNYTSPFFVYEPAKDVLTELSLKNFPANTDRVWHGFDIYETSPGNILIYAINHRRTGSVIERFHHTIGSGKLVWERTFDTDHDILFQPNDVAVVGKDDFYVTNVPPFLLCWIVENDFGRTTSTRAGCGQRRWITCVSRLHTSFIMTAQRDTVSLPRASKAPTEYAPDQTIKYTSTPFSEVKSSSTNAMKQAI